MSMMKTNLFGFWLLLLPIIATSQEYRSIDGLGNNPNNPQWGAVLGPMIDNIPTGFTDGISAPPRMNERNAREISNLIFHQETTDPDLLGLSDFVWAFGQFLDHDITLVHNHPDHEWMTEGMPIVVPDDDPWMTPGKFIPLMRSKEKEGTGTDIDHPRSYLNDITAFIDGSAVYGSTLEHAEWLRTFTGGTLKMSKGGRLPWNTIDGEFNSTVDPEAPAMEDAIGTNKKLFVAGDLRANENPVLLSIHTLFVREHNRICQEIFANDSSLDPSNPADDEYVYQRARKLVGAIIQHITYEEWLPTIGVQVPDYLGYDETVNPSVSNLFSAVAFRWGHTAINETVLRYNVDGSVADYGHINLKEAFFNPLESLRLPLEVYFKGMGVQQMQDIDCKVVSSLRSFLFQDNPVLGGLDLAAINIQRGRERGIPDYNTVRQGYGLERKNEFIEICVDVEQAELLESTYSSIDNLDPWVGLLAEDHLPNSMFGEALNVILAEQFDALRTGDRYYYQNDQYLSSEEVEFIASSSFSELVSRNTSIKCFQENVFVATPHEDIPCWPYVAPTHLDAALAPNPVTTESFLSVFSSQEGEANIRIVNDLGQTVYEKACDLRSGENHVTLDWQNIFVKGHFYVMIEFGDDLTALRALKI